MVDRDEEPTRPGTPEALRARRTPSGSFELPRELIDRLVDAKIHVLQERLAVIEADLAQEKAHRRMLEREVDGLRANVKRPSLTEIGPKKPDPRSV